MKMHGETIKTGLFSINTQIPKHGRNESSLNGSFPDFSSTFLSILAMIMDPS